MTDPGPTALLFDALAADLAANVTGLTYIPPTSDAGYTSEQTAVVSKRLSDFPDRMLCLTLYTISDDPTLSDSTKGLQVKSRGVVNDADDVDNLDDAVFTYLQNLTKDLPNGIRLVSCYRRSGAPMGSDAADRYLRTSNYELRIHAPSLHRS